MICLFLYVYEHLLSTHVCECQGSYDFRYENVGTEAAMLMIIRRTRMLLEAFNCA